VSAQPPPSWPPLSHLPTVAALLAVLGEVAEQQRALLEEVRRRPYALPADTVEGVVADAMALHDRVRLVAGQVRRWEGQSPAAVERGEIARATAHLERLRQVGDALLALAADLRGRSGPHARQQ